MTASFALTLLVAAISSGTMQAPVHVPTKAIASATATARILSGAKIRLDAEPQPQGYRMKPAQVTVEDGTRRSAFLVEFQ